MLPTRTLDSRVCDRDRLETYTAVPVAPLVLFYYVRLSAMPPSVRPLCLSKLLQLLRIPLHKRSL